MKITLLRETGEKEVIYNGEYRELPFSELYPLIGCEIVERLPLMSDEREVWVDEEGRLKDKWIPNLEAEALYRKEYEGLETDPFHDWRVAGNAVLVERTKEEAERYRKEEFGE